MLEPSLTPQLFSILSSLVEERVGLSYTPSDAEVFGLKVSGRALEAGFESLLDYYYYLRYDASSGAEFEALVEALTVNETYFFRELEPLRVIVRDVITPLVQQGRRPRIWCAACSSGEEPLTLAMLLANAGLLERVELLASDVSGKVLARARTGRYSLHSLKRLPTPAFAERWIRHDARGGSIAPELLSAISFRQLNLVDRDAIQALGAMDVVLCRNVLIYFRDQVVSRVATDLAQALLPGGVLVVGVSESLIRFDIPLLCEELGGVFLYRKKVLP